MTQNEAVIALGFVRGVMNIIAAPIRNLQTTQSETVVPAGSKMALYRGTDPAIVFYPGVPTDQFQTFADQCLEKLKAVQEFVQSVDPGSVSSQDRNEITVLLFGPDVKATGPRHRFESMPTLQQLIESNYPDVTIEFRTMDQPGFGGSR